MSEPLIGRIVKRGSNSNGEYVKFADGTIIQWGTSSGIDNGSRLITFPIEFIERPKVSCNSIIFDGSYVHLAQIYDVVKASCKVAIRYCSSSGGTWGIGSNAFDWIAIGKWK